MQSHKININCQASVCLNDNIYFDPLNIEEKKTNAKVVFITHSHWDHLDKKSILCIMNSDTIFVCTMDSKEKLVEWGVNDNKIVVVKPNHDYYIAGIKVHTFPAYNIAKEFHPKLNGWVGYTIILDDIVYTVCGDTDVTDELKRLRTDVLFVPVGGKYTMSAEEAAKLTNIIRPQLVIPIHYGEIVGGVAPRQVFIDNLDKNIQCKIII